MRVLTRVIGTYATHYLCDTGSLAISKDLSPLDASFGQVEGSDLLLTAVSQECGKLQVPDHRPDGSVVWVCPGQERWVYMHSSRAGGSARPLTEDADEKGPAHAVAPDAPRSKRAQGGEQGVGGDSKRSKRGAPEPLPEPLPAKVPLALHVGPSRLALGALLKIIPNHSCLTAACHSLYFVVRGDEVVDVWRPCHGW